jgi:ABC-type glycerol-3-phosphate transport system substrate-binding protein
VNGTLGNSINLANGATASVTAMSFTQARLGGFFDFGSGSTASFGSAGGTVVFALTGFAIGGGATLEVAGGALQAAAGNSSLANVTASAGTTRILSGATLDFGGSSATIANLQGTGTLTNDAAGAVTTIQGGSFGGSITGSGGLTSTGDAFWAGKLGTLFQGMSIIPTVPADLKMQWDVLPPPKGPGGRGQRVSVDGYIVAKTAKAPDLAWEMIKDLTSKSVQEARSKVVPFAAKRSTLGVVARS